MVGLAATKAGSGEKEKAYILKQNSVLKMLLGLLTALYCFALFCLPASNRPPHVNAVQTMPTNLLAPPLPLFLLQVL